MNPPRDKQLDALKGYAIILVVLGHVAVFVNMEYSKNTVLLIIYSFHMQLFLFISGYLTYGRFGPTSLIWIRKKFTQLIIPYVLFTIFFFYVVFWPKYALTLSDFTQTLFFYTTYNSAWFLPVLFESFFLLLLCIYSEKFLGKTAYVLFFFLLVCIVPLTVFDSINAVHQVVVNSPYVIGGYLACSGKQKLEKHFVGIGVTGSLLFPLLFWYKFSPYYPGLANNFFNLYYTYALAVAGIIFSWWIIKLIVNYKISYSLILCGIFSMEIYLTHLIILVVFSQHHWPLWFGPGAVQVASGTFSVIILSLILSLIIGYHERISTVIFGRWSLKFLKSGEM